jgi:2,4-dienoyl-CoA reductase-like NADH-dependent reductase (Old Yellow Enzyme family)
MSTPFPHLFDPLSLRHKTLKHRLNFGAHTANMPRTACPVSATSATTQRGPVAAPR